MDINISSMEEVTALSQDVYNFCMTHGCDERRAYHMSLAIEEMAGNVVKHGFVHDNRKHNVFRRGYSTLHWAADDYPNCKRSEIYQYFEAEQFFVRI